MTIIIIIIEPLIILCMQMTAAFQAMMAPPGESIDGTQQDAAAEAAGAKRAQREKPAIALITAVGAIVTGKGAVGELQQVLNILIFRVCVANLKVKVCLNSNVHAEGL